MVLWYLPKRQTYQHSSWDRWLREKEPEEEEVEEKKEAEEEEDMFYTPIKYTRDEVGGTEDKDSDDEE